MKVGLDASVVLRMLVGQPEDQTTRALAFLDALAKQGDSPVVSDMVAAEVYYALQHHYGISKRDALSGLRQLFAGCEVKPLGNIVKILETPGLASAKPGFVDRLIHAMYVGEADGMATFELSAKKLKFVRVL